MPYYRKRPVVVQAVCWNGSNDGELAAMTTTRKKWRVRGENVLIDTLEGMVVVKPGTWVVLGTMGELYPCHPEGFAESYEPVHGPL